MYKPGFKFILILLTHLLIIFNVNFLYSDEKIDQLKIGLLVPLSGDYKEIGKSMIFSSALAIKEIDDKDVELLIKDIGSDDPTLLKRALDTLNDDEIKTAIILTEQKNYQILNEYSNIVFISLSNKALEINKNIINFGINLESQLNEIFNFLKKQNKKKTIVLYSEGVNESFYESVLKNYNDLIFKKLKVSQNQAKLNEQIKALTFFNQRKINLESRIKQLESLNEDPQAELELKKLEAMDTLGNLNFDSIIILDFGANLKSILSTLAYVDAGSDRVTVLTVNQWFDESLFLESTSKNIYFPSLDLTPFKNFNNTFAKNFFEKPFEISIMSYDAIAYIYFVWKKNKSINSVDAFLLSNKIKGRSGNFFIDKNKLFRELNLYKVSEKSFEKL